MEFWKWGAVYFCIVKTFSSFQKLGAADSGGQPNNFFFGFIIISEFMSKMVSHLTEQTRAWPSG